jgi:hypothetical protein
MKSFRSMIGDNTYVAEGFSESRKFERKLAAPKP